MSGTTSYPGSADVFSADTPTPTSTTTATADSTGRKHAQRHDDGEAAIMAMQANAISKTLIDAKGDLVVGSAADTAAKLTAGANGTYLQAASGESTGVKWANGMAPIASGTFTTASTLSVDGCFTSAHDDYQIVLEISAASTDLNLFLRMRASSTDDSTASSYRFAREARESGGSSVWTGGSQDYWHVGVAFSLPAFADIKLMSPALAVRTRLTSTAFTEYSTEHAARFQWGNHQAAAYDGFTLYTSAGTITGTYRICGLPK